MDTDRIAEFVSTVVIVGMLTVLAAQSFGPTSTQDQILAGVGVAVVVGVPFAFLLVFVFDVSSSHVGPYDPEDVVFVAAVAPALGITVTLADATGLGGVLYGIVVLVGVLASILFAAVVRDLTVGEWPPGSSMRGERDPGNPPQ